MSYTPTEWKKGDVVTSEKLNNMEAGIAAASVLYVDLEADMQAQTATMDKTWSELNAGWTKGTPIFVRMSMEGQVAIVGMVDTVFDDSGDYLVGVAEIGEAATLVGGTYVTDSESGYPSINVSAGG